MNVIGDAAHCERDSSYIADDAAYILEYCRQVFYAYAYPCPLDVEDDVQVQFRVCVCHDFCEKQRLTSLLKPYHPYGVQRYVLYISYLCYVTPMGFYVSYSLML